MKKISFLLMLMLSVLGFALTSCGEEEECKNIEEAVVLSSEMTDTAAVNQVVNIKVKFDVGNGCGGFENATFQTNNNVVAVVVNAKYVGCICTQAIQRIEADLDYTPAAVGTYIFEYKQNGTVNTRDTLIVQ